MRVDMIRTKMKEIEESVKSVEDEIPGEYERFKRLGLVKDGIYKRIEFAIENVFDICAVINSDLDLGVPEGDEEIVDNLVEEGVLDEMLKEKLSRMKGFRNIVVHRYGKIDDRIAYEILRENIGDFYDFVGLIGEFLNEVTE